MSPTAQCIAIAKSLGWKYLPNEDPYWESPDGHLMLLPCYTDDLNLMHEVEKALLTDDDGNERCGNYIAHLRTAIGVASFSWQLPFATAAQRVEAFLKTKGLWVEEGTWWCNSHQREATHVSADGTRSCKPHQGGILLPCFVVLAPMTIEREGGGR